MPAAAPPHASTGWRLAPARRVLAVVWVVVVGFFGVLLAVAQSTEGPLDDPDPAFQRPGFLDVGGLPTGAPDINDVSYDGHRTVVFFTGERGTETCGALSDESFGDDVQLVVVAPSPVECSPTAVTVGDPTLAASFGLRTPRGGGAAVGYAIVDADGMIRYRTLDPEFLTLLGEVRTVLGAVS